MRTLHRPLVGLIALGSVALLLSCQPRRFNENSAQAVGSGGNAFVEELLNHHRNAMSPDLVGKLGDTSFYVFNRGCAAGMPSDEVARRPIDGSRDPAFNNSPEPFPHLDTCQNSYIDPANYDMRAVVRRKFDSTPGSGSPGTPRMEGQSSVVDVFQIPPSSPRFKKRCYNSLPSGRAIYRVFNKAGSSFSGVPYYEVRSHDVTVGVIVDIQRVVNEGLDRSSSDQVDLESGFYPRVYLMPGLCGVGTPVSSKIGKTPGGLPGSLPAPGSCNPSAQNPTAQNPACKPNPTVQNPVPGNPSVQQPNAGNPTLQQPSGGNPTVQQPGSANPAQQSPVLVPRSPNGSSQQ
ncbi:MAG: hypothetical protein RI932_1264 [Pseudomonadota bacterium]